MKYTQARGDKWRVKWSSLGSTQVVCHARHHCCTLATVELAIANMFLQWQENLFYLFYIFILKKIRACLGFCVLVFWV